MPISSENEQPHRQPEGETSIEGKISAYIEKRIDEILTQANMLADLRGERPENQEKSFNLEISSWVQNEIGELIAKTYEKFIPELQRGDITESNLIQVSVQGLIKAGAEVNGEQVGIEHVRRILQEKKMIE